MIRLKERKLALLMQTHQLQEQLGKLRLQDHRESQLHTYTGRKTYVGLMDLVESLNGNG